jgi:hypothetical protein
VVRLVLWYRTVFFAVTQIDDFLIHAMPVG